MSQAKVDRYKKEKKNRAKIAKRKKIKTALCVFLAACIVGAGIGYPLGKYLYKRSVEIRAAKATIMAEQYDTWAQNYWYNNYAGITGIDAKLNATASDTDASSDTTASDTDAE